MRRTREQWATLVAAFENTNQPAVRFCERRGISPRTFAWWRWRLRHTAPSARRDDGVKLLSVDVVTGEAVSPTSRLVIAIAEVEVRIDVGVDVDYVAALVARLRHA
jgi:hypothetical protein